MNIAEAPVATEELVWFKSSYSGAEGGECLEVASRAGAVHVRDSKDLAGPVLIVSGAAWSGFVGLATEESAWFKSSYSSGEGGECVEVARAEWAVRVRDSKRAAGPVLTVSPGAWARFVRLAVADGV